MIAWLFFLVLGLMLSGRAYFKTPYALSAMVGVPCAILMLYVGFIFNQALIGYYLVVGLACCAWVLMAYQNYKSPSKEGLYFILLCIGVMGFLWLISYHNNFVDFDDYGFWALRGKALFIDGHLPKANDSYGHMEYPLACPIWQYFVFQSRSLWSISSAVWANNLLLIMPLLSIFLYKPFQKGLLLFAGSILLILYFSSGAFHLTDVDNLLATWVAGVLIAFYAYSHNKQKLNLLVFVPAIAFLVLAKPAGIMLALLLCVVMLIETHRKQGLAQALKSSVLLFACVIVTKLSWILVMHYYHYPTTFDFSHKLIEASTWKALFWPSSKYDQSVRFVYIYSYLLRSHVAFALSAFVLTVGMVFLLIVTRKYFKNNSAVPSQRAWCALFAFGVLYFFSLWIIQVTLFRPAESLNAASIDRYFRTFFLAVYLVYFIAFFSQLKLRPGQSQLMMAFVLLVVIIAPFFLKVDRPLYLKFKEAKSVLKEHGIQPDADNLVYLWQLYHASSTGFNPDKIATLFNLLYYPKKYNTVMGSCVQFYFDNTGKRCHFTKAHFFEELKRKKAFLMVVDLTPQTQRYLNLPEFPVLITNLNESK